ELVRRAEFFPVCVRAFLVSGYRGTVLLDLATAGVAVFETRAGSSVCLCAWIGVGVPGGAGVGRLWRAGVAVSVYVVSCGWGGDGGASSGSGPGGWRGGGLSLGPALGGGGLGRAAC